VVEVNKPLAISTRQALALLKAAEKAGGIVEVKTPIGVVRLIPAALAGNPSDPAIIVDEDPEDAYRAWKGNHAN
jgi:hypothetical protein